MIRAFWEAFFGITSPFKSEFKLSRNTQVIDSTSLAAKYFRSIWDKELINKQEQVHVIFVDEDNVYIKDILLHTGGKTKCFIDIPLLFRYANSYDAVGIFIAHNHPKGNLKATKADVDITNKIKNLCIDLDFVLLDHIIITPKSYFSFAESRLI